MHLGGQSIAVAGLVSPQEEISQISGTFYDLIQKNVSSKQEQKITGVLGLPIFILPL